MLYRGLTIAAALAALTCVSQANAQQAKQQFGKIDLAKIYQSYAKVEESNNEIRNLTRLLQSRLDIRNTNRLLSDEELTELQNLKEKAAPTDAEKARIKELEDAAKQRDTELRDLQAKKEPTDQERARMAELQSRVNQADKSVAELAKEYEKQVDAKRTELTTKVNGIILAAVKDVAEAQGLSFVVDQRAVLYGGADITDAVLAKLNAK